MKRTIIKNVVVSGIAIILAFVPTTTAMAGAHHRYGGGYHHGGYYAPPAQQYNTTPQNYTSTQATVPKAQPSTNSFDPTIYDIQVVLFEKGYYEGDLDGLYGSVTKAALLKFQEDNGMTKAENSDVEALKSDLTVLEALGLYTLL